MNPSLEKREGIPEIRISGVPGLPEIRPGDRIPVLLQARLKTLRFELEPGDICLITQKIISKAEGAVVDLRTVTPSPFAQEFARRAQKDPRLVEVVLQQSRRIVRMDRDVLICETRHGWICANAGVDQSNVPGENSVAVLPADPDESARRLCRELKDLFHFHVPVILTDTFGRPWREGLTNVAIGCAGLEPLVDWRGKKDSFGFELQKTLVAVADELASAAELVMSKTQGIPAAIVRGYAYQPSEEGSQKLIRPAAKDMFR
jgi:coenzyme F420-0:L-glutamate ligase / coenzyme F420-1:gamma-L-glutamate ligase